MSNTFFAGPPSLVTGVHLPEKYEDLKNPVLTNPVHLCPRLLWISLWIRFYCICMSRWRQLTAGRSLKFASYRGGWGERSFPRSATEIPSVVVDRIPNLPIGRRTQHHWVTVAPKSRVWLETADSDV